jgi:hypothetical protein
MIIADVLSISLYRELLFKKDKLKVLKEVYYLEPPRKFFNILKELISFITSIKFVEIPFFIGDFTTSKSENLYISTRADFAISTVKKCENIIEKSHAYKLLSERYDILNVLKVLSSTVQELCFKNALNYEIIKKRQVECKKTIIFYSSFPQILASNHKIRTVFLKGSELRSIIAKLFFVVCLFLLSLLCFLLALICRVFLSVPKYIIEREIIDAPYKVLTQCEGPVLSNQGLRTHPFWNTQKKRKKAILTILFQRDKAACFSETIMQGNNKVIILPRWILLCYMVKSFGRITNDLKLLITACWSSCELIELAVNLNLLKVLINSHCMSEFCKKNRIKVAVSSENYLLDAISFGFCRNISGLKFFSYQYACRDGAVPPAMLANCDIFFSFSRIFNEFWCKTKIKPKQFISFGFFFHGDRQVINRDSQKIKKMLCARNINSAICYLDESIQFGKYGLIKLKDYVKNISSILSFCEKNIKYGLVLKPQFVSNSILFNKCIRSVLKCDQPIRNLFELIFRHKKHIRNLVLPQQAAEVSFCVISHSFSATAGIETALSNKPTFLLNTFPYGGKIGKIFLKNGLTYKSVSCILNYLTRTSNEKIFSENAKKWRNVFRELEISQTFCATDKFYNFLLSQIKNL